MNFRSIPFAIIFIAFWFTSCKQSGEGFDAFTEIESDDNSQALVAPKIKSYTPIENPVVFLGSTEKTFALTLKEGSADTTYDFTLDGISVKSGGDAFYVLNSSSITPGSHTLLSKASNTLGEDSITFNLFKNTPPQVTLGTQTATSIVCSGGSYLLSVNAVDSDGDYLSYQFLLNGQTSSSHLVGTGSGNTASVTFTANCSLSGTNFIIIRVTDSHGESSDYSANVTVTNPYSASIDGFLPTTEPTVILSTSTVNFSITPGGTPPFSYEWSINPGSVISSCNGLATCPIAGTDFTPGRYLLTSKLTDSTPSNVSKTYTVVLNQKPQITGSPSNLSTLKMNCSSVKNFNLSISDLNFSDSTQSFSVQWLIDGNSHTSLTSTNVLNVYPMTSQATFSPGCNSLLIGDHTISAIVSDGHESVTMSWPINVNYFSDVCNSLSSGQICTAVGRIGMAGDIDLTTDSSFVAFQPFDIEKHSTDAYFVSDRYNHGIWFLNNSSSSITVLGLTIGPKRLKYIIGHSSYGNNQPSTLDELYLNNPSGMAYDNSSGALYIADTSNSRVLKIDSSGNVTRFAGGGSSDVDGATRTAHYCNSPQSLVLDNSVNKLFVTCNGNTTGRGSLKYFSTNADVGSTLIKYGTNSEGSVDGMSSSASINRAYAMTKHPTKKILFISSINTCNTYAVSYGDSDSFYNGSISVTSNNMVSLTPSNACGNSVDKVYNNTVLSKGHNLSTIVVGGVLKGLVLANNSNYVLHFLNLSSSSFTIAGNTIASGYISNISLSGYTYSRGVPAYLNAYFKSTYGLIQDGSDLILSDTGNGYISKLDLNNGNSGYIEIVGSEYIGKYDSEVDRTLTDRRLYRPTNLIYREDEDSIYVVDEDNYRIRKLDLLNGSFKTVVGDGNGGYANVNPVQSPLQAKSINITAINFLNTENALVYTDTNMSIGTNRNCHSRLVNLSSGNVSAFGQNVPSNYVQNISGLYSVGCNNWLPSYENTDATSVPTYYPNGIISNMDDSELYISDFYSHCVFKIDSAGQISSYIGTCGTSGNGGTSTISNSHLLTYPGVLVKDRNSSYVNSDNYFLIHRARASSSEVKYINNGSSAVIINFITINPGEIKTIISSLNYVSDITSYGNQICYSQGMNGSGSSYVHNIECIDRDTGGVSIRIGRPSAAVIKADMAHGSEQEGINASSSTLSNPGGLVFDGEGNLWFTEVISPHIRKVKRWF